MTEEKRAKVIDVFQRFLKCKSKDPRMCRRSCVKCRWNWTEEELVEAVSIALGVVKKQK